MVGGGDQAQIDLRGSSAQALHFTFLQHAQKLHLHVSRNFADLVEEKRTAVGLQEAAVVPLNRARKSAALITEQLGFQNGFRQGRTVNRDEGPRCPLR